MKKIINYFITTFNLIMMRLGIGMRDAEQEIFSADPNLPEKDLMNQHVQTKNPLLRKMELGIKDEKYVQDFYEVLKKADEFMKNSTREQMERAAAKYSMNIGMTDSEAKGNVALGKDRWGRRYDHFGFFDSKNKNYGKTLGEVLVEEAKQRITSDDDNEIEFMFSNIPHTVGFVDNKYIVEDDTLGFRELSPLEKARAVKPPLLVVRDNEECVNKIELLTEYVHVRKIDRNLKIIEFFIPAKFKVFDHNVDSEIFKEIINIKSVWMKDEYDTDFGYAITGFYKNTEVVNEKIKSSDDNVLYHVIKLYGKVIEELGNG